MLKTYTLLLLSLFTGIGLKAQEEKKLADNIVCQARLTGPCDQEKWKNVVPAKTRRRVPSETLED